MGDVILELKNITKYFPGITALDRVHFDLRRGEIHALMGENGAGKSTFIKVVSGVHRAEEGEIWLDGKAVSFRGTRDAQQAGIATIYQHVTAYQQLSVAENIFMGHELVRRGIIRWSEMNRRAQELLTQLGADFAPTDEMEGLSVARQQLVEIAKALSLAARIIVMDEPTAALSKQESEHLYTITEKLKEKGVSIIFISHRFEDVYRLADRVTVFRDARYIGTWQVAEIERHELIQAMVGREINELFPKTEARFGKEVLRVEHLSRTGYFSDVSFAVREGEILGLTGLVGAGRTEVIQCVCGVEKATHGRIFVRGQAVRIRHPQDAMALGIGLLSEDRQRQGLILDWGIGDNITLPILARLARHGFTDVRKERALAKEWAEKVDVKARTLFDTAQSLSGGNQQKVVVAKLLASRLKILVLDEPTKGVDIGAKAQIYQIMSDLAEQGYAIVMISSEMPEILAMCDRIMVMGEGRVTGFLDKNSKQEEILKLAMYK